MGRPLQHTTDLN
jgi:hypothetical protein